MLVRGLSVSASLLIVLFVPLNHAMAGVAAPQPVRDKAFCEFWAVGLSGLEQWRPDYQLAPDGAMRFRGLDGAMRSALLSIPKAGARGLVLHITDDTAPKPVSLDDGLAHCVFAWRYGVTVGPESVADARRHPLYRAALDACRLTQILGCVPGAPVGEIALLGEGYGATIALAVAALMPGRTAFVIAHQPVCVATAIRAQAERAGAKPSLGDETLKGLMRFSPRGFAPLVHARTLITVGLEDDCATPRSVISAYDKLRCAKAILAFEGLGHCSVRDINDWERIWREWAFSGSLPT